MLDIFADTETTGLGHVINPPREDAVVEAGLAYRRDGSITSWTGKMFPGERFFEGGRADKALEVNHHTLEDLRKAPPPTFVWGQFAREIELARAGRESEPIRILCWNNAFDEPFMRADPVFNAWLQLNNISFHCAMVEVAKAHGKKRVSLKDMCEHYGVQRDEGAAHRADYDAVLALMVYESFKAAQAAAAG